uniref:Uncharacterized protein n=1 Tax=Arundo donax TaxID=35708 RepID=A0A0A9GE00_ARUDO
MGSFHSILHPRCHLTTMAQYAPSNEISIPISITLHPKCRQTVKKENC